MDKKLDIYEMYRFSKAGYPNSASLKLSSLNRISKIKFQKITTDLNKSYAIAHERRENKSNSPKRPKQKSLTRTLVRSSRLGTDPLKDYFKPRQDLAQNHLPKIFQISVKPKKSKQNPTKTTTKEKFKVFHHTPDSSTSTSFSKKIFSGSNKPQPHLADLQNYLYDFHKQSKFLLSQLEEKILGKDGSP